MWGSQSILAEVCYVMPGWSGPYWCCYPATGMSWGWQMMVTKLGAGRTGAFSNTLIHKFL